MHKFTAFAGPARWAIAALLLVAAATGVYAQPQTRTVAVVPFAMNSPQDLTFLQNGLFSMLSSRLSDPGKVSVLDRETIDLALGKGGIAEALTEDAARKLGSELGVDYILFGSLTHFGESVSLDAAMVDVTAEKPTLAFFEQSSSMGDVIPLVNRFAGDVNLKVFNRTIDNQLFARPAEEEPQAPGALSMAYGPMGGSGGFMQQSTARGFETLLRYEGIITAMAVGDLNQDGRNQVVAATDETLMIYGFADTQLVLEKTIDYGVTHRIVALDIGDVNGNGYPEIFVTSLTIHQDGLQSFVVEYNGSDYVTTIKNQHYYYRLLAEPDGQSRVLMGQATGSSPFEGRIYTLTSGGSKGYVEEKRVRMPRDTSVLSLARGPVTAENATEYISINRHGRLVLANDGGTREWKSSETYGGTALVWLMPKAETDASFRERIYIHPRLLFHDVNQDGRQEVVVIKNHEIGGGMLGRYKRFKNGQVLFLTWNGIAMAPVYQTTNLQGWISDVAIADLNQDGKNQLIVSVVSATDLILFTKDTASNIIIYDLE